MDLWQLMCLLGDVVQVILCQKHSFLDQLTQNMTTDFFVQEKYKFSTCCDHPIVFFLTFKARTQHELNLQLSCSIKHVNQ